MPNAISPMGTIAGGYTDANFAFHGFVRASNGTFTIISPPGSFFINPVAINAAGTTTGQNIDGNGSHGFVTVD